MRDVPALLTRERIGKAIEATMEMLQASGVARPRLAVSGYNPHAGEGGLFGREEIDVIAPAVATRGGAASTWRGIQPTRLAQGAARRVVRPQHVSRSGTDRAQASGFRARRHDPRRVPIPIATPAHGTAYDIVGRGVADPSATIKAFETCSCKRGKRAWSAA